MEEKLCRLCLGTENLLYIFDGKVADEMVEIIHVTSGVQISKTDPITKMVCSTCCQITIKMFKFRNTSIKNDKDLKAKQADYNLNQLTNSFNKHKIESTIPVSKPVPPEPHPKYKFAHPSVKKILEENPGIILSNIPIKSHFGAYITLMTDEVDEWFQERNISKSEIEDLKRIACEQCSTESNDIQSEPKESNLAHLGKRSRTPSTERSEIKKPKLISEKPDKPTTVTPELTESKLHDVDSSKPKNNNFINNTNHVTVKKVAAKSIGVAPGTTADSKHKDNEKTIKETCKNLLIDILTKNKIKGNKSAEASILESVLKTAGIGCRRVSTTIDIFGESNQVKSQIANDSKSDKQTESHSDVEKSQTENKGSGLHIAKPSAKTGADVDFSVLPSSSNTEGAQDNNEDLGSKSNSSWEFDRGVSDADSCSSNYSSIGPSEGSRSNSAHPELNTFGQINNTPDLSLVTSATKSHSSFICKICDSEYLTKKELKRHQRRTHTKCPFCFKRFRTLSSRFEHIKHSCVFNTSNFKQLDIPLVRVDEDEKIRQKYPTAFEQEAVEEEEEEAVERFDRLEQGEQVKESVSLELPVIIQTTPTPLQQNPEKPQEKRLILETQTTSTPLQGKPEEKRRILETQTTPPIPLQRKPEEKPQILEKPNSYQKEFSKAIEKLVNRPTDGPKASEKPKNTEKSKQPVINKIHVGVISESGKKTVNRSSTGIKETGTLLALKEIEKFISSAEILGESDDEGNGSSSKRKEEAEVICISDDESETIKDSTNKTTADKDTTNKDSTNKNITGKHTTNNDTTNNSSSKDLKLIHNINLLDALKNSNGSDADMIALVKKVLAQRKGLPLKENLPKDWEKEIYIVDGSTPKIKIFKNLRKYLHQYKIPIQIKYNSEITVEYKPAMPPPETKTSDLWTNMVAQELKRPIVVAQPPVSVQCKNNPSSQSGNVLQPQTVSSPQIIAQFSPLRTVQNKLTSTTSLVFTSRPSTATTAMGQTYTTSPLILNGGNSGSPSSYTNFILVPSTLLTTAAAAAPTNLPASQGPLPIIQSVRSLDEQNTNSSKVTFKVVPQSVKTISSGSGVFQPKNIQPKVINTTAKIVSSSNMDQPSGSASTSTTSTTSAIRVKSLSELF